MAAKESGMMIRLRNEITEIQDEINEMEYALTLNFRDYLKNVIKHMIKQKTKKLNRLEADYNTYRKIKELRG